MLIFLEIEDGREKAHHLHRWILICLVKKVMCFFGYPKNDFFKYFNLILFSYFPLSILKKCAIIILIISCISGEWREMSCVSQ